MGVHDYFERALRAAPASDPMIVAGPDGNRAGFEMEIRGGRIVSARYRATSCATLLALCERAAELVTGMAVQEAARLGPESLLIPGIPASKRDRAGLAAAALRAALPNL